MPDKPEHYDICIYGNREDSFQKAVHHAMAGDFTALIHEKPSGDKDFSPKIDIILQALYASARAAHNMRIAHQSGVAYHQPEIHWPDIQNHIKQKLDLIAPHYSFERLKALGVHVIQAPVQDETISAKTVVREPEMTREILHADLEKIDVLSLKAIIGWKELPEHLIILGDGARALSLAQGLHRLGCKTSVVAGGDILDGLDRELYKILFERFEYEGIRLIQDADIVKIDQSEKIIVHMEHKGARRRVSGSHLLNMQEEETKKDIFALTDPAIAQTGLSEDQAREKFGAGNFHLIKWRYQECDFATSMGQTNGLMKIITKMNGQVLGAGICGEAASDLIAPWTLAIQNNLKITDMKDMATSYNAYSRMITLSVEGYISQIANPARQFKGATAFWQSLIGGNP
ncbi:MAG: NAD-binding protein [Alphaproteobacteria bacterium]